MENPTRDKWYHYRRTVGTTLAGPWIVAWVVCRSLLELTSLPAWERVVISLVPLPFFAWFLRRFMQYMRASDELQRRIELEALAVAFPLAIALLMTLGLLLSAKIVSSTDWTYTDLWIYFAFFYVFGRVIAQRRYA